MPKIVINIDEYDYEWIKNAYAISNEINIKIAESIINGMPLPKNHGDLIDRDELLAEISTLSHWQSDDGQDLAMVADMLECIDKHIGERREG